MTDQNLNAGDNETPDGFLKEMSSWTKEVAEKLAKDNSIGSLNDDHWMIIEFVKRYYDETGQGPPIIKISKHTGFSSGYICELFPCGVARGAYRLAGLPRPSGCI